MSTQRITNNFDLTQSCFLFSWISNYSSQSTGTPQELADLVYKWLKGEDENGNVTNSMALLKQYKGDLNNIEWDVVWGPGVYEIKEGDKGKADNTAYVVKGTDTSTQEDYYIVAIAGTNPKAVDDFLVEDLNLHMVDWENFNPLQEDTLVSVPDDDSKPQITMATAKGLYLLATQLVQSSFAPPTNQSLGDFLMSISGNNANVIFVGHSLGGALAPTMARWMREKNTNLTQDKVSALPVAGATPGNACYQTSDSSAWDNQFPSRPVACNEGNLVSALNENVRCDRDVVPHAWMYIFSDTVKSDDFYFSNPGSLEETVGGIHLGLYSNMGTLVPGEMLRTTVTKLQKVANEKKLTQTLHPNNFDMSVGADGNFENVYMITTQKNDKMKEKVEVPLPGPLAEPDFSKFMSRIGKVHLWSYGQAAFNIDISVWNNMKIPLS